LFLTKPINSQFFVSVRNNIDFGEAANFTFGIILVFYALGKLGIRPDWMTVIIYCLLVFNAVVLAYSLWFINMTTSFWFGRIQELHETFISIFNIARYPIDIFQGAIKLIFVYFLPLAVLVSFSTRIILGSLTPIFGVWALVTGLLFLFLSNRFWRLGLRRYSSASS